MASDYRTSEEILLNQWQPLQTILYDGWVLRFADGYTKRANSVNPIYFSTLPVHEKIKHCEQLYTAHGLKTIFKITPFVHPEHLDELLEYEGYTIVDPVSVKRLDLSEFKERTPDIDAQIDEWINDEWVDRYCQLNRINEQYKPTMKRMFSNYSSNKAFFTLYENGDVAACGLGIVERGVLGIFDIVTSEQYRNRGFGQQLILHILNWGKQNGGLYSDLSVLQNNEPALKLYSKFGFQEIYQYWFRVK